MQPITYETEAERSRVGREYLRRQIEKTRTKPRKRKGGWLTEQGWDALLILAFALGVGGYLAVKIGSELGPVLRAHGLL